MKKSNANLTTTSGIHFPNRIPKPINTTRLPVRTPTTYAPCSLKFKAPAIPINKFIKKPIMAGARRSEDTSDTVSGEDCKIPSIRLSKDEPKESANSAPRRDAPPPNPIKNFSKSEGICSRFSLLDLVLKTSSILRGFAFFEK